LVCHEFPKLPCAILLKNVPSWLSSDALRPSRCFSSAYVAWVAVGPTISVTGLAGSSRSSTNVTIATITSCGMTWTRRLATYLFTTAT
jgi:hypothetical protein